jgi:putative ABC transport system permease protein
MAMSIRERTREVSVMRTLGFSKRRVLSLLVGEAVASSMVGGLLGAGIAYGLFRGLASLMHSSSLAGILKITGPTILFVIIVAALVGLLSGIVPAYRGSRVNIAAGLRHLG